MAKWYYIDGEDGDLDAGAYNMDWYREVAMEVASLRGGAEEGG